MRHLASVLISASMLLSSPAHAARTSGFGLDVLVDGTARTEYPGRGAVYVEAVRGKAYVLRLTNPLGVRVAVALAVDGLNTIDARHTDARGAAKWVLGPFESVEIPGWQVSGSEARSFVFTGEKGSYGAWLGATENLGVIEAVFYRERACAVAVVQNRAAEGSSRPPARPASSPAGGRLEAKSSAESRLDDEAAATGVGDRRRHDVDRVFVDLEREPAAVVRVRYEFRGGLVRLGLLPAPPLDRRERASGFSDRFCPEPPGR
jgi:hypothetical protein